MRGYRVIPVSMVLVLAFGCSGGEGTGDAEEVEAEPQGTTEDVGVAESTDTVDAAAGQEPQVSLPGGVTMELVNRGREVFLGAGTCHACHGRAAEGMPNLGADLTDSEWRHSDGSFEGILNTVMNGVPAEASSTGVAMPPRGVASVTEAQARAAAAYVYYVSREDE